MLQNLQVLKVYGNVRELNKLNDFEKEKLALYHQMLKLTIEPQ